MNTVFQNKTNTKNQMESVLQTLMNERNYTKNEAELTLKLIQIFGIDNEQTADDFLHIQNVKYHSPMLLKDIDKVILRLVQAIVNKEKVMFHGDYDADGVTTTALFIKAMRKLGLDCDWYVPHRQKDGYGLHPRNIKRFEEQGYDLLVTGDTGIKEMKTISETTMDVIVTDHHEPVVSATREGLAQYEAFSTIIEKDGVFMAIPTCIGVINPHRIDCDYPNTAVAGVTVIFKVMSALYTHLNGDMAYLASLVDYVAVGMIADMIEQINLHNQDLESRKIVLAGIRQIEKATNTWSSTFVNLIAPLSKFESMKVRGLKVEEKKLYRQERNKGKITIGDLGFKIGPFLNAPGRMGTADLSVEFLLEEEPSASKTLIGKMGVINQDRKDMKTDGQIIANEMLKNESDFSAVAIVLPQNYHSGIVGLIAGDLARAYEMPTLCFAKKELDGKTVLTASCRSVEGVSILEILIEVEKTFGEYRYGGHQMAAGLTIDEDRYDEFKEILNRVAKKHLEKKNVVDTAIPVQVEDITQNVADFYISMGSKSLFSVETSGLEVLEKKGKVAKFNLKGNTILKFYYSASESEVFDSIGVTDQFKLYFKINRMNGENNWMIEKLTKI